TNVLYNLENVLNMRLSKTMKKILVVMLKDSDEWWQPLDIVKAIKPEYQSKKYLYDREFYRILSTLAENGYLIKEKRPGPYKGRRIFKLSEKGKEKALQIKQQVTSFMEEWQPIIEEAMKKEKGSQ
ncbi:MAG: hypothetical protein QXP06_07765, partial [Candidatus Bathyarchaeia archaeon]